MKKIMLLTCCALSLTLTGCQHSNGSASSYTSQQTGYSSEARGWTSKDFSKKALRNGMKLPASLSSLIPKDKVDTPTRTLAAEGIVALDEGRLEEASELFNTALRLELNNSFLHFMNGLAYHLMAKGGNAKNYEFAEQGYEQAYKFDPSNALAKYYLGLAYMDQRKFEAAEATLAVAAMIDEDDPEILYDLARAAYFAGDPRTSRASLDKLKNIKQNAVGQEKIIRASILTNAALGMTGDAYKQVEEFRKDPETYKFLSDRVADWKRFYDEAGNPMLQNAAFVAKSPVKSVARENLHKVQAIPGGTPRIPGSVSSKKDAMATASTTAEADFVNADMAVVDVVIIRTQEDVSTNRGMNLLSGLELQFGDSLTNTPGLSFGRNKIDDTTGANNDTNTRTLSRLISVPAVNYSLNIFNTLDGRNEILASPSLVALANERSEFFSGVDVVAAAVSGGDGSSISVNKKIGVKLSIVPEFLPDDRIKLAVQAERTFLTSPSSSVQFEFRLDTSNTNVNANVVMKFGETLVLSGLSEKETESSRNAVPVLGDIPVVQYLFSKQSKRDFRKSVLIMLTPRRAQYVNQSADERQRVEEELSKFEKSLTTFESRNKNWFVPKSTMTQVIETAEANALFHEFRTGDLTLENWNTRNTHGKRLKSAVDFLFY